MNVIDIGSSYIKSYLILNDAVVDCQKKKTRPDKILEDTILCYANTSSDRSQSTVVLSTSDSIVWEDQHGNAHWLEHQTPAKWQDGLTPYEVSGHPRYEKLKGSANQMLYIANLVGLKNIKRILPLSAYIATMIADNPTWNGWDYTHASNSGFYDYGRSKWAKEAEPFIDAGIIDDLIYESDTTIEGNTFRRVYIGGHDSVFANANDSNNASKPYISCGTWTTVSIEQKSALMLEEETIERYVGAPNGSILKQLCYYSEKSELEHSAFRIINFLSAHSLPSIEPIKVFGSWSKEMHTELQKHSKHTFVWIEQNRFFGDTYLPLQTARYILNSPNFIENRPYFCEGA